MSEIRQRQRFFGVQILNFQIFPLNFCIFNIYINWYFLANRLTWPIKIALPESPTNKIEMTKMRFSKKLKKILSKFNCTVVETDSSKFSEKYFLLGKVPSTLQLMIILVTIEELNNQFNQKPKSGMAKFYKKSFPTPLKPRDYQPTQSESTRVTSCTRRLKSRALSVPTVIWYKHFIPYDV